MKNLNIRTGLLLLIFAVAMAAVSRAADIDFSFEVPRMPYPPKIEDVSNSSAIPGGGVFTVTARITAQTQMKGLCDIVPVEECTNADWYQMPDPDITPNPPAIQKVSLYYYRNDGITSASSMDMTYDAGLGRYKADVPLAGVVEGDTITLYIVAIDSRGNVASQAPDPSQRPCPSTSSWDASLATPATSNCSFTTSYSGCNGEYISGTPGSCNTTNTVNDKTGDVCGEPNANGLQSLMSGAGADKVDMLGLSAGADGTYVCANLGLRAPTPTASDPAPIETYLLTFYNPDVYDPNPGDTHIENALAITYAPEAVGSDPTLVKDIWSGDCVTDPDTSNPLDCKLISSVGFNDDLKIEYGGGSLKFMVKKSGTGNPLAIPFNLMGAYTKMTVLTAQTGEMNLSGGTAFWVADRMPALAFYQPNKIVPIGVASTPAAPVITATRCSGDGTGGTSKTCGKEIPPPTQNVCAITFSPVSPDKTFTTEYRVYRNTQNNTTGAVSIGAVAETNAASYTYPDTHTSLTGSTYYYFLTAYNAAADKETALNNAAKTSCTLADADPPQGSQITSAATPPGNEKKCRIKWSVTTWDPSLSRFYISRSDDNGATYSVRNLVSPVAANPDSLNYEWTDPATLEFGNTYKYKITAVDLGDNTAVSSSADCVPSDLKAPDRIWSLLATGVNGKIGVSMDWQPGEEPDIAGYNAYYCKLNNKVIDCRAPGAFSKINNALITGNTYAAADDMYPTIFTEAGDFCIYVEVCDDCDITGTCPENGGAPNCSGFPTGGADSTLFVKCINLTLMCDGDPPAFPSGASCIAPPEGNKVEISWDPICHNSNGVPFSSYNPATGLCPNPYASELVGYKVVFGNRGAVPDYVGAQNSNIAGVAPLGVNPEITHSNLTNGTEYCYIVYGVDGGCWGVSKDSVQFPKIEVCCTPRDTLPPAKPVITNMAWTPASCTPQWPGVSDKDTITYNVYRCQGTTAECNTSAAFGVTIASGISQASLVSYEDSSVTTNMNYRYCITAVDPYNNQSAILDGAAAANCAPCTPSNRAAAVSGVVGAAQPGAFPTGVALYWDNNVGHSAAGCYNVYRCADSECAAPGEPIAACDAGNRTIENPLLIDNEPAGDWHYGVTYLKDSGDPGTESLISRQFGSVGGPVHIAYDCDTPIVVSSCADYAAKLACIPVQRIDTGSRGADGKFALAGAPGLSVYLAGSDNTAIGGPTITDGDGNYNLVLCNDANIVNTSQAYKVVLVVPAADKQGVPCSPGFAGNDCRIQLNSSVRVTDDNVTTKVSGLNLPAPGGGRAEIANPDCSNAVDVGDLLILKAKFGSQSGDSKFQSYADFDGNGRIDVEDFLILKKNFGKTLDAAPVYDPMLCKPQ